MVSAAAVDGGRPRPLGRRARRCAGVIEAVIVQQLRQWPRASRARPGDGEGLRGWRRRNAQVAVAQRLNEMRQKV
jgi:hypothetical protein